MCGINAEFIKVLERDMKGLAKFGLTFYILNVKLKPFSFDHPPNIIC